MRFCIFRFKGHVLHSHDYKHMSGFEDKRILIIGIGNSGGDAAVELSRVASQVFNITILVFLAMSKVP